MLFFSKNNFFNKISFIFSFRFLKRPFFAFFALLLFLVILSPSLSRAQSLDDQFNPAAPNSEVSVKSAEKALTDLPKEVGKGAASAVGGYIVQGIIAILEAIAWLMNQLVILAVKLLEYTLDPNIYNLTKEPAVNIGWTIIRDICNLLFLLVLLFISFCTILQIDKYHIKKTLLTLVIMALLINFSKPIAIFIFDGSQLIMNYFINLLGGGQGLTNSLGKTSHLAEIVYDQRNLGQNSSTTIIIQYLFIIIFLFMFAVAVFVMAIFLIIRLIAMWIIVMVAPIGFFANILPDFKSMSTKWWDALFKYSYVGPAIAFFLYMSTKIASISVENAKMNITISSSSIKFSDFFPFIVSIAFLYMAVAVSQQFGIHFASAVTSRANKVLNSAAKIGGTGLLAAGTLGQYWRGRDYYQGAKKGISKTPYLRHLTDEGRKKFSEERQAWMAKKTTFGEQSMADIKDDAKKRENDTDTNILSDVAKGNRAAILEASNRGILTKAHISNPAVKKVLGANEDLRKAVFKNNKTNSNAHLNYQYLTESGTPAAEAFSKTLKMSESKLAEQKIKEALCLELTATSSVGGDLSNILTTLSTLPHSQKMRRLAPLISRADDPETKQVLTNIQNGNPPLTGMTC